MPHMVKKVNFIRLLGALPNFSSTVPLETQMTYSRLVSAASLTTTNKRSELTAESLVRFFCFEFVCQLPISWPFFVSYICIARR
jgi:hypothetical protein